MGCKGICENYRAYKIPAEKGRYNVGHRHCSVCGIYIEWQGKLCPCCRKNLRFKPRTSRLKDMAKKYIA